MSYPGLTFALMVGVAIGTAIYYYFKSENTNQHYQYRNQDNYDYCTPPPAISEGCDTLPRQEKMDYIIKYRCKLGFSFSSTALKGVGILMFPKIARYV